jgi:hypothetical protein
MSQFEATNGQASQLIKSPFNFENDKFALYSHQDFIPIYNTNKKFSNYILLKNLSVLTRPEISNNKNYCQAYPYASYYPDFINQPPPVCFCPLNLSGYYLPNTSNLCEVPVILTTNTPSQWLDFPCVVDEYLSGEPGCLVTEWENSPLLTLVKEEFDDHTSEFFTNLSSDIYYSDRMESDLQDLWIKRPPQYLKWPSCYTCKCQTSLSATSLKTYFDSSSDTTKSLMAQSAGLFFSIKSLFSNRLSQTQCEQMSFRFLADAALLATNFSISSLFLTFMKFLNEITPAFTVFQSCIEFFYNTFKNLCSTLKLKISDFMTRPIQPTPGLSSTSYSSLMEDSLLESFKPDLPVISAAMASIAVICASLMVGVNVTSSKANLTLSENLANAMACIAKQKNGLYAVLAMMKDFGNFISQAVSQLISGDSDDLLVRLINSTDEIETDECQKKDVFEYIEHITKPENLQPIMNNSFWKKRVNFVYNVLTKVAHGIGSTDILVPQVTTNFINKTLNDINKLRNCIFKTPSSETSRFTPFWINFIGQPGTRKSQFVALFVNSLYQHLKQGDYEIPANESEFSHSVNFSDKYLTNYRQQYVLTIDDLFQDNNCPDINSALNMISWCSNVTHYTNQAALDDKGIAFESKIIVSSSNDEQMSRNDIKDITALKRRMRVRAKFEKDESVLPDPLLGNAKIRIDLQEALSGKVIKQNVTALGLIAYSIKEYKLHYALEKQLLRSRKPTQDILDQINNLVNEDVVEYPLSSTSGITNIIRCKLGLKPTLMTSLVITETNRYDIQIYDCECSYHSTMNEKYKAYVKLFDNSDFADIYYYENPLNKSLLTEKYKSNYNDLINKVKACWNKGCGKIICAAIGGFIGYYSATKFLNHIQSEQPTDLDGTAAKYEISRPKRAPPRPALIASSYVENKSTLDLIHHTIKERSIMCTLSHVKNGAKYSNNAFRLRGQFILTNHHFMNGLSEKEKFLIEIQNRTGGTTIVGQIYEENRCYRIGSSDLVVYHCSNAIAAAKNMLPHFPNEKCDVTNQKSLVVSIYKGDFNVYNNVIAKPIIHRNTETYTEHGVVYDVLNSYITNCPVMRGMSGSILIGTSNKLQNKILGVQTCQDNRTQFGYFTPVSRQQLEQAMDSFNDNLNLQDLFEENCSATSAIVDLKCPSNLGQSGLNYIGTIPNKNYVNSQSNTKIIPSLVQKQSELTQLPSVLNNFDERMNEDLIGKSIILRSMQGFDDAIGTVDLEILNKVISELKIEYDVSLDTDLIERRLLSDFEMVNGIPKLLNRLNMRSSPGYPYVLQRKNTTIGGKYEWFEEITPPEGYGKAYEMLPSISSGLKQRESAARKGINLPTIAYACLKDETRPIKKIQEGKTRAFICLPMDYNLLIKKYFGAFIAAQHLKAGTITSCVGLDPATQWRKVYDKLKEKNSFWEDFDYANWDQHLHPDFIAAVSTIVNHYYGVDNNSEEGLVRRVLLYDLVHTTIIVKDKLFVKSSGQCSGCAITAELNCIVHDILMYYVWNQMNPDTNLTEYRSYVASIMYGDDIVISVDPLCPINFNGTNIQPYMQQLGMNITPGDKESTTFIEKKPNDIFFLKRNFVKDGEYIKAPLRRDIVENIIQWIHKSDDDHQATILNCETALQESYMHGRDYYLSMLKEINNRIKLYNRETGLNLEAVTTDYEYFDRKYKNFEFVCVGINNTNHSGDNEM